MSLTALATSSAESTTFSFSISSASSHQVPEATQEDHNINNLTESDIEFLTLVYPILHSRHHSRHLFALDILRNSNSGTRLTSFHLAIHPSSAYLPLLKKPPQFFSASTSPFRVPTPKKCLSNTCSVDCWDIALILFIDPIAVLYSCTSCCSWFVGLVGVGFVFRLVTSPDYSLASMRWISIWDNWMSNL